MGYSIPDLVNLDVTIEMRHSMSMLNIIQRPGKIKAGLFNCTNRITYKKLDLLSKD
jgi:ribosomal protein L7Ae-like RNA K-turn-binding protein